MPNTSAEPKARHRAFRSPPPRKKKNRKRNKTSKVVNVAMTPEFLDRRAKIAVASGYDVPKYVHFIRVMLEEGYEVTLYEARRTVSKYVTIHKEGYKSYKVRFSNHKPIESRELSGDCDFFVGRTNLTITTTAMAICAVREHFGTLICPNNSS